MEKFKVPEADALAKAMEATGLAILPTQYKAIIEKLQAM